MQFVKELSFSNERAIYLPIFAGILIGLILIIGLGIDAANVYLTKMRLHRALDGAVTSAAYAYHEQMALVPTPTKDQVRDYAAKVVQEHLQASIQIAQLPFSASTFADDLQRMPCSDETGSPASLSGSVSSPHIKELQIKVCDDGIWAQANVKVPPTILGALPFKTPATTVTEEAMASQYVLTVAMVLDTSGSMGEAANPSQHDKPSCTKIPAKSSEFWWLNCSSKIDALKYASNMFISTLVPGDRLAIIAFQRTGKVIVPMKEVANNDGAGDCSPGKAQWTRACFRVQVSGLKDNSNTNIYDGIRYGGLEIAAALPPPPDRKNKNFMILVSDGSPIDSYTKDLLIGKDAPLSEYSESEAEKIYQEFFNWSSVDNTGVSNITKSPTYWGKKGDTYDQERMFNSAINLADDIRKKSAATIYSVGFGKELIPSGPTDDPYQGIGYSDLKPVLLHRIANDKPDVNPAWPEFYGPFDPNQVKQTPGSRTYAQVNGLIKGKYYHADTGDELKEIFQSIGMLMRTYLTK